MVLQTNIIIKAASRHVYSGIFPGYRGYFCVFETFHDISEYFLYGRKKNFFWGGFGIFFSKNRSKWKKFSENLGVLIPKTLGYTPDLSIWRLIL